MKRTLFISLLILLFAGTVFAQLRNYIPIVRPVYDSAVRDFFNTLRRTMDGIGYKEIGTMLGAYVKGGYGSGFVYVARDGANYVVTNYHVVAGADAVNLEFERQDGTIVVYQNCPVIAANKAEDLALVSFRHDRRPFRSGLSFSNKTVRDGMEVWTAGYPALLDKPMWQLGKGNVTNSVARVPELVDPKLTPLIQHSAQVDAGNSGGPLLVADRSSPGGFKVIGVNSWKVVGRQAANFSVPAVRVKKFINASLAVRPKEDSAGTTAALERTCRGFSAAFTAGAKPYREIMVFISRDFVLKKGEHILPRVLASAPHSIRDEILSAFYNASPIEAVRMALAYYLYMAVTEKKPAASPEFVRIEKSTAEKDTAVHFSVGEHKFSTTWKYTNGKWSLGAWGLNAALLPAEDASPNSPQAGNAYNYLLLFGSQLYFEDLAEPAWVLGFYVPLNEYISWGTELGLCFLTTSDGMGSEIHSTTFHMALAGDFHVPLRINGFSVIPYVSTSLYFQFNEQLFDYSGFLAVVGGGVKFGFSKEPEFILGCGYMYAFEVFGFEETKSGKSWLSVFFAVGM